MVEIQSLQLDRKKGKSQPLYKQIDSFLRDKILNGNLREGQRLPAPSEIVKSFNLEYVTVNAAYKSLQRDGLIKLESGRGKGPIVIKKSPAKLKFMFVRWDFMPQSLALTEGIRVFCDKKDISYTITYAEQSHQTCIDAIKNPREGTSGIILMPHDAPGYYEAIRSALEKDIHIVFVDRVLSDLPVSSVSMDHIGAGYQVTNHLLEHERPVYYFGFVKFPSSCRDRLRGWTMAMREHGYLNLDDYVWDLSKEPQIMVGDERAEKQLQRIENAAIEFFQARQCQRYTILCHCDSVAHAVYRAAEKLGMQIGQDVALAGFGNTPICDRLPVGLTSVSQPDQDVGYEAAKILFEELSQTEAKPQSHLLPVRLIIRESSQL